MEQKINKRRFRSFLAFGIVLFLLIFFLYTVYIFIDGFFGGLILYVILFPLYSAMVKRGWNKKFAAWLMVIMSIIIIILPLLFLLGMIGKELFLLFQNPDLFSNLVDTLYINLTKIIPELSRETISQQLMIFGSWVSSLFLRIAANIGSFIINLFIALLILYFMLINSPIYSKIKAAIPFNKKNSNELVAKLKDISYTTVFTGSIIALVQGGLLAISFFIFGVSGAILWGFIAGILSFFPLVGPPLIWIPAVIIQFFQKDYWAMGGILFFGIILSNIDNLIRPYLGEKISRIHPLITVIGIFIGVYLFGLIGLFVGPLLLAFAVLALKMFKEEYYD